MEYTVAIVILNWNGKHLLEKFLPAVLNNTPHATIYVADNCSTDNSVDFLSASYPEIKILRNDTNCGFAEGYNKALSTLEEDYFVLLNSDVEVTPNWLTPMIELLESDPVIACCQPKIKDYNNKTHFEYAGAAGGFIDRFGYPFCKGRIFTSIEEDLNQYEKADEIFWASGACMLIRGRLYKECGGLDSSFFAHMEEIDLCWRLINRGYKIYYTPHSTVYHIGGGTLSKVNSKKTYLNFRNSLWVLIKNLHTKELFATVFFRLVLDGMAGIKFLLEGKPNHCMAIIRAHLSCYISLRQVLRKRRNTSHKPLKSLPGVYPKSIVYDFFVKKKQRYNDLEIPDSASFSS